MDTKIAVLFAIIVPAMASSVLGGQSVGSTIPDMEEVPMMHYPSLVAPARWLVELRVIQLFESLPSHVRSLPEVSSMLTTYGYAEGYYSGWTWTDRKLLCIGLLFFYGVFYRCCALGVLHCRCYDKDPLKPVRNLISTIFWTLFGKPIECLKNTAMVAIMKKKEKEEEKVQEIREGAKEAKLGKGLKNFQGLGKNVLRASQARRSMAGAAAGLGTIEEAAPAAPAAPAGWADLCDVEEPINRELEAKAPAKPGHKDV